MRNMNLLRWSAPVAAWCSLVAPSCSDWPESPGGSGGAVSTGGRDGAGTSGEAGTGGAEVSGGSTATGGAGGASGGTAGEAGAPGGLPVIGCAAGEWPESAELTYFDQELGGTPSEVSGNGEVLAMSGRAGPIFWTGTRTLQVVLQDGTARALSCEGTVMTGSVSDTPIGFRADQSGGLTLHAPPPIGGQAAEQTDISATGDVALGSYFGRSHRQPVLWNSAGEYTVLSQLADLRALRLVPDARTIWGSCDPGCAWGPGAIFKWTQGGGFEVYPTASGIRNVAMASDGSAALTYLPAPNQVETLNVFDAGSATWRRVLCPAERCAPTALSTRGRILLFYTSGSAGAPSVGWIWDPSHGVRTVSQFLATLGVPIDAPRARLSVISDDGRVLAGTINPGDGLPFRGFRLVLPRGTFD